MSKKNKRLIIDIVSYIVIGISLLFSIVGLIIKVNKGTLYIFNHRADVVLTNSMSAKNEQYKDFLEGHDDQIQPLDLVISRKLNLFDELEVYDIVLFNNPNIGTTVHRVVGKEFVRSDKAKLTQPTFNTFAGNATIQFGELISGLNVESTSYKSVDIVMYSTLPYGDHYNFTGEDQSLNYSVSSTQINDYYEHRINITRESSRPTYFNLSHKDYFNYKSDYFIEIIVHTTNADLVITSDKYEGIEPVEDVYTYETNKVFRYEIRGDLSNTSDGKFTMDSIYAKVTNIIPKIGIFFRFISSIYGIILLVGLTVIAFVVEFALDHMEKKAKLAETNNGTTEVVEDKKEEDIAEKENKENEET